MVARSEAEAREVAAELTGRPGAELTLERGECLSLRGGRDVWRGGVGQAGNGVTGKPPGLWGVLACKGGHQWFKALDAEVPIVPNPILFPRP